MVQVFTILFFVGLGIVLVNFLYKMQRGEALSWSVIRVCGYVLTAVSSVFFAMVNPNWFHSLEGYTCAVAFAWTVPFAEEWLLFWIWELYKRYCVSI